MKAVAASSLREKQQEEWFEAIWKSYTAHAVRSGSKKRARTAWKKLNPDEALVRQICAALKEQYESADWKRGIGVPHFSTWLNGEYWENQVTEEDSEQPEDSETEAEEVRRWV